MLSLNNIVKILENQKINNAQLNKGTFLFGDPWEYGANNTIQYPLVGINLNNSNLNGNLQTFNFNVFVCDLVHKDESNETEVLSDLHTVTLDYWANIRMYLQDLYNADVNLTANLTDFTERFDDEVTGWQLDFSINQFYDRGICDTPDSGENAGKPYIVDQNGNVLAYLNPGQAYTVEVLQAIIDTINNNTSTIIDPIN